MKFLINTHNPARPDARRHVVLLFNETRDLAWTREREWLSDKIIGEPRANETHTVKELKDMNLVGVYKKD